MGTPMPDGYAVALTLDNDRKNLSQIDRALESGRIDNDCAEYLRMLYSDSMDWFREVFHLLGKSFGAPKAPVMPYDYETDSVIDTPTRISDINPLSPYLVQHRLDADPMRNQFFKSHAGHRIDLSVSSIVTVIVAAQKRIERALDKVTGKYYDDYIRDVAGAVERVLVAEERSASARAISDKVRKCFSQKYITNASETVLSLIGGGHEKIAVQMVRALDKIEKPYQRLRDVWRVKCLFDLVPQARTFIERLYEMMPDRVISNRDKFYDMTNPRNYRDAKIIVNISRDGKTVVPMEIICQVRTFFEFESKTHSAYETARKSKSAKSDNIEANLANYYECGVKAYNNMICHCLEDLFERVGWNILYSQDNGISMFEGFPKECKLYYPQKIFDIIIDKVDNAIENEVFHIENAPIKLTQAQESRIFRYMARFVLVSAMPYMQRDWNVPASTQSGKFFNFVMGEVQRYYKKQ